MPLRTCCLALVLTSTVFVPFASASVVRRATLETLAAQSQIILHGVVNQVDEHLARTPRDALQTAVEIEIYEPIKGLAVDARTFRLVLPGGRRGSRVRWIPGMPQFRPGEEVVLLLETLPGGSVTVTGLEQGAFRVERGGPQPRAVRRLQGMRLVEPPGAPPPAVASDQGPVPLEQLLATLRQLSATGGSR